MERLIFRAFLCEMELDYITVSRLFLVPVAKGLWKHWELVSANLSELILTAVVCSASLCIWLRNILRNWFVTTVSTPPTHVLQPHIICTDFLWWFRNNSFAYLSSLFRSSRISIRKTLGRIRKSYAFSENDLKHELTLAKNLLRKASKLPISLEQFLSFLGT